jgi:uncharacterized protein (DUF924 family)
MTDRAEDILRFWFEETGDERRFASTPEFDALIRERFLGDWEAARDDRLTAWEADAHEALALVVLLDQFPRNMFRGEARAFATDAAARAVARRALDAGHDLAVDAGRRMFFYLPFEHSEDPADQDLCVRLVEERLPADSGFLIHARVHREIVRRFGRFPARNAARGLAGTAEELAFLDGGYGRLMKEFG